MKKVTAITKLPIAVHHPASSYGHSEAQILRDFRVVQISLYPVQYKASTQQLQICTEMTVEIAMNGEPGQNELPAYNGYSYAFKNLYESMILNFDDYRDPVMAPAHPRVLLIYGNNSDSTFQTKLSQFLTWKRQKGFEINAVSTQQTGGSSNTAIKGYIQNQYNNLDTRPDFVIILGDVGGIFSVPTFTESWSGYGGEGDYPYTHLAGSDYLGDAFIGRISAENISQLDVLFTKIYTVERDINISGNSPSLA